MVSSAFDQVLNDFELFFNCPLKIDANHSCLINMENMGISLQLELNKNGQLIIACVIASLSFDKYRDKIVAQALKSNDVDLPSTGIFGYSIKTNHLIFFLNINPAQINSESIFVFLPPFIEKACRWKEAINSGETPKVEQATSSKSGLFGL